MSRVASAARTALATLGIVALLVVVESGAARAAGAGTPPCRVLRRAEITAAFGQPATRGSNDLGTTFCQWDLAATPDRASGQVVVFVAHAKAATRAYRLMVDGAEAREPVGALGRRAFSAPSTGTVFVLIDRSTFFYVQANLYAADATTRITDGVQAGLIQLATRAEARL